MMCTTKNESATRFRHHFLDNGAILTIATCLTYDDRSVRVGWSVFNPDDDRWIRKMGASIARNRMNDNPLMFTLSKDEPVMCDYISLRALLLIISVSNLKNGIPQELWSEHPSAIPKKTLKSIHHDCHQLLNLLGCRVDLGISYYD